MHGRRRCNQPRAPRLLPCHILPTAPAVRPSQEHYNAASKHALHPSPSPLTSVLLILLLG
jgi:hypothetical protein